MIEIKNNTILDNTSFICALFYCFSALSFTITKKFNHGLETKVEMKGMNLMVMICICMIGVLCGSATTVGAGDCSSESLNENIKMSTHNIKGAP